MSLEVIGGWLAKLGWVAIVPYLVWIEKKDKTKLDNTFTKRETQEIIEMKIKPITIQYDSIEKKFDNLMELIKTDRVKREENFALLQDIKSDVRLTNNDIEYLKENVSEIKKQLK